MAKKLLTDKVMCLQFQKPILSVTRALVVSPRAIIETSSPVTLIANNAEKQSIQGGLIYKVDGQWLSHNTFTSPVPTWFQAVSLNQLHILSPAHLLFCAHDLVCPMCNFT